VGMVIDAVPSMIESSSVVGQPKNQIADIITYL
jgi:hypothetical protein